jgi:hypothetical protein
LVLGHASHCFGHCEIRSSRRQYRPPSFAGTAAVRSGVQCFPHQSQRLKERTNGGIKSSQWALSTRLALSAPGPVRKHSAHVHCPCASAIFIYQRGSRG